MLALQSAIAQGVLWGIMVLGIYITYRLLDIADLTVDGSFALGGCVCAILIMNFRMDPLLALVCAGIAGVLAGAVTGILHTIFEIPAILAGILTQIALWSVNLRITSKKSNVPLLQTETIMIKFMNLTGLSQSQVSLIIGLFVAVLTIGFLYWFFGTELGSALRATGNNEDMVRALGVDTRMMKLLALMISNGLVGLSGGLVCQSQKYGDIGMGTGAIVIGLASIVIGEVLLGRLRSFAGKLTSVVVGCVVYFMIRSFVLNLPKPIKMDPNDMKLFSAIIVALALCIPVVVSRWKQRQAYQEGGE